MKIFGKDWKKVEEYIGTRTGAQIRSHAQKYFQRIEKELNGEDIDEEGSKEDSSTEKEDKQLTEEKPEPQPVVQIHEENFEEDKKMELKD
mmetsp:Transcript_17443/g.16648  ORF Transcript_17443/g.16648 Transcript_17443/m.16648 type:complete len:90 (-) Transcript_17443:805-1074(-)|eukprot:CAMPEP_0170555170 /NCGR_PEP_ID=MMETSP0211-20121228/13063_1 /TAXON_ID=311385 /ORGANISM="Pseudokeronopsis sp., Strain OXSARD2" /LENGTH=89 /DNA_ID=CAMNT_0010864817 /DNA_START=741 /DNA_END=1010 /DNA_ORIENTATION=-